VSQAEPSPPESFSEEQERAWATLVSTLRRVIAQTVQLDGGVADYVEANEKAEALEARLAEFSGGKPVPRFRMPMDKEHPTEMLPYSAISGKLNPLAPPVSLRCEGERLVAEVSLGGPYEGGLGFVHGGMVAMIWDQVLALTLVAVDHGGPTVELTVRYRAPTPINVPLRFEAWLERDEGRKAFLKGQCFAGETLLSEASGVFVRIASMSREKGFGSATQRAGRVAERRVKEGQES